MTESDITLFLVSLALLLGMARIGGELASYWNQPSILGEILAGIVLGPTVLGAIAPNWEQALFPTTGPIATARGAVTTIAIVFFVLVAGMEVELSRVWKQGRSALLVSVAGIVLPFAVGMSCGWFFPTALGRTADAGPLVFALFLGVALSISALPVIAKTLFDLKIFRTDLGMVVISSAIFDDLVGWLIFALVLGMMDAPAHGRPDFLVTAALTIGFAAGALTLLRWGVHKFLPWLQAHTSWPGGVLGFALTLSFLGAACTEWIGVHAIFGSFLIGIAIGDSSHLREQTRKTIGQFVSFSFAPIFFASLGLKVNYYTHFDLRLTLIVLLIACVGKIVGCGIAARIGGMSPRESLGVGMAMNARGAMEIILGVIALQNGLIDERVFVALVVMAIVTSMLSGPALTRILRLKRQRRIEDFLVPKSFVPSMKAHEHRSAIRELGAVAAELANMNVRSVQTAVLQREELMPTGLGNRVAVPHARIAGLASPVVVIGLSADGVDFDAPDGDAAQLIFLLLTPRDDGAAQVSLLADIARRFGTEDTRKAALRTSNFTELLALLRTQ